MVLYMHIYTQIESTFIDRARGRHTHMHIHRMSEIERLKLYSALGSGYLSVGIAWIIYFNSYYFRVWYTLF